MKTIVDPKDGEIQIKTTCAIVGRKPAIGNSLFKTATIGLYDVNNPHKENKFPKVQYEFSNIEKVAQRDDLVPVVIQILHLSLEHRGFQRTRRMLEVRHAVIDQHHDLATGGLGALLATKVKSARPILFKELGPEAIYRLEVKDFPLIVGIDSKGINVYPPSQSRRDR